MEGRIATRLLACGTACVLAGTMLAAGLVPSAGMAEEVAQKDKAAVAMAEHSPEVVTLEDGTQLQTIPSDPFLWNTTSLKGDKRGCTESGCHTSILDATQEMDMPHPELWNPYNVDATIKFCYMCHSKALYFQDSMHAIHNTSTEFAALGGSCDSCHYVSPATGEFEMWDLVKYNEAYMGISNVSDLSGATFSFTQDTITDTDEVFYYWENNDHRGVTPDNDTSVEAYENWEITVDGDAASNPFTFKLSDYEDQMVERTIKMDCQTNPPAGAYVCNVVVKGIPLATILEDSGVDLVNDRLRLRIAEHVCGQLEIGGATVCDDLRAEDARHLIAGGPGVITDHRFAQKQGGKGAETVGRKALCIPIRLIVARANGKDIDVLRRERCAGVLVDLAHGYIVRRGFERTGNLGNLEHF